MTNYIPKHREDGPAVTEPRVQPVPRHVGEYAPEERSLERLGAEAPVVRELSLADLLRPFALNPFRPGGVA